MIAVSIVFVAVAIPMIAGWAIVRNLAAAHHQQYREDIAALDFASTHPLAKARPLAKKTAGKRIPTLRPRTVHGHGRHSTLALR